MITLVLFALVHGLHSREGRKLPDLYWNSTNPIFRLDNTDHIIDVNMGTAPHQPDTLTIICPSSTSSTTTSSSTLSSSSLPNTSAGTNYLATATASIEKHIVYNVNRDEYYSCSVRSKTPRVVAYCDNPLKRKIFTLSFRSFSPLPGVLEFLPGQDYYFISTSQPSNLANKDGGYCATSNMKLVIKVGERTNPESKIKGNLAESPNRSKLEGGGEKSEQNVQVLEFQELPLTEDESEEQSGTVLGGIMEKKKNTEEGRRDRRIQMKKDIDSKQTQEEPSLLAILREYRLASRGRDLQAEKTLFLLFSAVLYQCLLS